MAFNRNSSLTRRGMVKLAAMAAGGGLLQADPLLHAKPKKETAAIVLSYLSESEASRWLPLYAQTPVNDHRHCEPTGPAVGRPDDGLREAISRHMPPVWGGDCFVALRASHNNDGRVDFRKPARRTKSLSPAYRSVIASPLKSALASNPTSRPVSSSTAPFWLVSTIPEAPRPIARPAPAAP